MPRSMLQLRIEALSQHLEQAKTPSIWRQLDLPCFNVDEQLWNFTVEKIYLEAGGLGKALSQIEERLANHSITEREGWHQYRRIQLASEEVFQECLDLLGGLALRDRIQDERICRVADEYIKELAADTGRPQSFSIPGLDTRLSSTLRRVAKMQFPEWTVWTLPLVAHEYGHVVIAESTLRGRAAELTANSAIEDVKGNEKLLSRLAAHDVRFRDFMRNMGSDDPYYVDELVERGSHDADLADLVDALRKVYLQHRQRIRILFADAVATLLAGPAYAYAALLLRLNPLDDGAHGVADQDRAAVILEMLRLMNTSEGGRPPPHGDIVDELEQYWADSVEAAGGTMPGDPTPGLGSSAPIEPEDVRTTFQERVPSHENATYERRHSDRARQWSKSWCDDLLAGRLPLGVPELAPGEHIREALNALWRARVELTKELDPPQSSEAEKRIEMLSSVGLALSERIIEQRRRELAETEQGGSIDPGRASRPRR